jgi:hypothetical protein
LLADVPPRIRPQIVMLYCVLLTFAGIVVALAGDMGGLRWLKFAGVFMAIGGMFSIIASSLILEMRSPKRFQPENVPQPATLRRADTTNKLLPVGQNDFVPSVVENTTELLQPVETRQAHSKKAD